MASLASRASQTAIPAGCGGSATPVAPRRLFVMRQPRRRGGKDAAGRGTVLCVAAIGQLHPHHVLMALQDVAQLPEGDRVVEADAENRPLGDGKARRAGAADAGNRAEDHHRQDERADARHRQPPDQLADHPRPAAEIAARRRRRPWPPASGQRTPAGSVSRGRRLAAGVPRSTACARATAPTPTCPSSRTTTNSDPEGRPVVETGRHHDLQQAEDGQLPVDRGLLLLKEQDQLQPDDQVGDDQGSAPGRRSAAWSRTNKRPAAGRRGWRSAASGGSSP